MLQATDSWSCQFKISRRILRIIDDMKNMIKMISPTYLQQFQCIGGSCEDSCCVGWEVEIDRITFRQYFRTKDSAMRNMFQTYLYKNEDSYNVEVDYGKVRLGESMRCPFLDCEQYCKIYSSLGESFLSNVCTSFPRVTNAIDDFYEMSLYLSCPEAARLILLDPNGIRFQESIQPLDKHVIGSIVDTRLKEYQQSPVKYFKEIREKCIRLVQNRKYPVVQRLFILGLFLEGLDEKSKVGQKSMLACLNSFNPDSCPTMNDAAANLPLLISLFQKWIGDLQASSAIVSGQFIAFTRMVQDAFLLDEPGEFMKKAALYEEASKQYVDPFLAEYAYVFENYLVNQMFISVFPFSQTHCMFDGYIMLIVRFLWIRFYLAGIYAHNKKASLEDALRLMQVMAKTLNHNTYYDGIFDEIKDNEYDHMEFVKAVL